MRKIIINNTHQKKNEKIKAENHFSLSIFSFSLLKRSFSLFTFLFSLSVFAQTTLTTAENYIYEKNCLTEDCSKKTESVQYFDGLGRVKQSIAIKATPTGKDIAVPVEYDAYGRQVKSYLPVPQPGTQNGAVYTNPLSNAPAQYGGEKIYTEKILEPSPLGRIQQQKQVGNDWAAHPVQFSYATNTSADAVTKYTVVTSWIEGRTNSVLSLSGTYPANTLYKSTVTDEDGNVTTVFKNKKGQTLVTRKKDGAQNADTYYVYNEYSQLAYTIPPLAASSPTVSPTALDNLCYQYRYDGWNRLVEKKIPGKGWEYRVYDIHDRVVAVRDANMAAQNQWLYTKYDQFGRVAYTGISVGGTRITEQTLATGFGQNTVKRTASAFFNWDGMDIHYDHTGTYPNFNFLKIVSVNYYDTYPPYSFNPPFPATIMGKAVLSDNSVNNAVSTKSLPVMSVVKNIEDDNWTKNYMYYDNKGRIIGTHSINHLGGYTKTESDLDFIGLAKQTKVYHKRLSTDTEKIIVQTFEYDSQNRLLTHKHKVDNNPEEILAQNTYNELSQLKNKKVGGTSPSAPLQSIDYQYNIRGWMTKINDPATLGNKLFGYEVKYNTPAYTTLSPAKYNGNIAEIDWKTANDGISRRYSYAYDALNRLKNGIYSEPNASVPQNNFFNETMGYDLNGNITALQRTGKSVSGTYELIDNLTYNYTGNKLNTITDASVNYGGYPEVSGNAMTYDDNGNMKSHKDKGLVALNYNLLNLTSEIKFDTTYRIRNMATGEDEERNVRSNYTYRADGTKLRKKYTSYFSKNATERTTTTDYLDGFQYTVNYLNAVSLDFVPTSEGYYNFKNNKYIYSYRDHLGNVRLSYFNNGSSVEALEENNYYPFGLKHEGYNELGGNGSYSYMYNGKELQNDTGMLDYGWRQYMPESGRWNGIDQLAENYLSTSPFAYVANNPVSYADVDGRWFNEDGSVSQAPATWDMLGAKYKSYLSFSTSDGLGVNSSGVGGGGYTFTGNAASSMFSYFANGGNMSGISFENGLAKWWTDLGFEDQGYLGTFNILKLNGNSFWKNITNTNTYGTIKSLIPENYFIRAENEISTTKGKAGILNIDLKNTKNIEVVNNSVDMQLNLSFLSVNHEISKESYSTGATISIGSYSFGVAGTTAFDIISSDVSVKFGQKLDNYSTSNNTYGIKPLTAAAMIVGYVATRMCPPSIFNGPIVPAY